MKEYDVIVIGSGAGMNVGANALENGLKVALVEHGTMGGTCLNNGCIPSKILLYPADVIRKLDEAASIGVEGKITKIDMGLIMKRMRSYVDEGRISMERGIESSEEITWYDETGEFVDDYTMKVGSERIRAPRIIIASGSRPKVPPVDGLEEVGYINNVTLLDMRRPPKSLLIIGGGYIACEYGHFFSALGTDVTIIGRNPQLLPGEEPEISGLVRERFSKYVDIHTGHEVIGAKGKKNKKMLLARDRSTGKEIKLRGQEIMVAAGRRSNADLLKFEKTGVETDEEGWVKVDEHLQTSKENIWALGDALGKYLYRHTANYESRVVWQNAFTDDKVKVDYHAVPHAVFGYPEVGGVGLTERQAKEAGYNLLIGKADYGEVTKGYAMAEKGLVKIIVDRDSGRILGCNIVGAEASDLIMQVTYLMNAGHQDYMPLARAQVIHPALSEVVVDALANMVPEGHEHHHHHGHDGHGQ